MYQERKRHINLKNSSGQCPGVPGTAGGTNKGLPASVPKTRVVTVEKLTDKGLSLAGTPAGCPRKVFRSFRWFFLLCRSLIYICVAICLRLRCMCLVWIKCRTGHGRMGLWIRLCAHLCLVCDRSSCCGVAVEFLTSVSLAFFRSLSVPSRSYSGPSLDLFRVIQPGSA